MGLGGTHLIILGKCTALHADALVLHVRGCHLICHPCVSSHDVECIRVGHFVRLDNLLEEGTITARVTLVLRGP